MRKLEAIANSVPAAQTLRAVVQIAEKGEGALTEEDFKQMAELYTKARDELWIVLQSFPEEVQREYKRLFGLWPDEEEASRRSTSSDKEAEVDEEFCLLHKLEHQVQYLEAELEERYSSEEET